MRKRRDDENESDVAHNLRIAAAWPPPRWRQWLLTALRHGKTAPLRVSRLVDSLDALEDLFTQAPEELRDSIREGVAKSVREWDEKYYDLRVLDRLCWAAERLRVSDVVPPLAEVLRYLAQSRRLKASEGLDFEVADDIVSIVAGFAPDRIVEELCSDLLFNDHVTHRLASLLVLGICLTSRPRFAQAVNQFMIRRAEEPEYFDHEQVAVEFTRAVSSRTVAVELRKLSDDAQRYLVMFDSGHMELPPEIAETRRIVYENTREDDVTYVEWTIRYWVRREHQLRAAGPKQTVTETILDELRADLAAKEAR